MGLPISVHDIQFPLLCQFFHCDSSTLSDICCVVERRVNECAVERGCCSWLADCIDTEESWECVCRKGYKGNGFVCQGN